MDEVAYIFRVKISRNHSKKLLSLSRENYFKKVLEWFNMLSYRPMDTPIIKGDALSNRMSPETPEQKAQMSRISHAGAVGSLMYAMLCTRPNICFAVSLVSRYQFDPGLAHWKAIRRIMSDKSLKSTLF